MIAPIKSSKNFKPIIKAYDMSRFTLKKGDRFSGFTVTKQMEMISNDHYMIQMEHQSGAKYIHIETKNKNNIFGVSFKTPTFNDKGIPHVLEHCVLSGSKKYPISEPFMKMLKRSINSYMNAMTSNVWTFYVFRTNNLKDYKNLMDLYIDSVFYPLLRNSDFLREGFHINRIKSHNYPAGVVYNEMKGVYSDPDEIVQKIVDKMIFGNSCYSYDSGGDPKSIPKIRHEDLLRFHKKFYVPPLSLFYTYGDLPVKDNAKRIHSLLLKNFDKAKPIRTFPSASFDHFFDDERVRPKKKFPSPDGVRSENKALVDVPLENVTIDSDAQHTAVFSFVCEDVTNTQIIFDLKILVKLLFDGVSSFMYERLIKSGIACDFSSHTGFSTEANYSVLSIGLVGMKLPDAHNFDSILKKAFTDACNLVIPIRKLRSIYHKLLIKEKHLDKNFGINLGIKMQKQHFFNMDPVMLFNVYKKIINLNMTLKNHSDYFCHLIQTYFINNSKKSLVISNPVEDFMAKQTEDEKRLLNQISSEETAQMEKSLKSEKALDDISCLPSLSVDKDIVKNIEKFHLNFSLQLNGKVGFYSRVREGDKMFYCTIDFDIEKSLPARLKPFLPLFVTCLTQFNIFHLNCHETEEIIDTIAHDLKIEIRSEMDHENVEKHREFLTISAGCLDENILVLFELFCGIAFNTIFDDEHKLRKILEQSISRMSNSLNTDGLSFAGLTASSVRTPKHRMDERYNGLSQLHFLTTLLKSGKFVQTMAKFRQISRFLPLKGFEKVFVVGNDKAIATAKKCFDKVFSSTLFDGEALLKKLALEASSGLDIEGEQEADSILEKGLLTDSHFNYTKEEMLRGSPIAKAGKGETMELNDEAGEGGDMEEEGDMEEGGGEFEMIKWEGNEKRSFISLPIQCNYVYVSLPTVPYTHSDYPTLLVLGRLMQWGFLHREIREKGNAYGSGAYQSNGEFVLFSYRDPNAEETLERMAGSIEWVARNDEVKRGTMGRRGEMEFREIGEKEVEEAKLATFSAMDRPISHFKEGEAEFRGRSDAMRQATRDGVFAVTRKKLVEVAKKYLLPHVADVSAKVPSKETQVSIAIAGQQCLEGKFNGWRILNKFE